ncbi:Beta-1,3-glucosyltransferase [Indibacter alkaliphilus LW1]|uniref:Beta-1,3-glucosyltransferase n=1 Tax=Indibacter alkaliphilus (strain CCUG 57479 / KCTC 22604 / LW1) TaxID=1189612 RepID=S2DPG1_INDAL|nr:glycosyltransferase family A protein [Indibacter alkaliphilus]EOZ93861.1 Beta-1,3-glucosyltransferase [Indibacter alkaliphilus LW1]
MFSIVIPLYNKELSITNTLRSVLNQTFKDFEVVIVNDGSTDKSVEKVEAFKDPRIRLIHQENAGVSAARNKGIVEAKNEWITFLDADDLWMERHLVSLNAMILRYPEYQAFCTSYVRSNRKFDLNNSLKGVKIIKDYFVEAINYHFFWTGVVCLNKSVFQLTGNFDPNLVRGEDLDLWIRIGKKFEIIRSYDITAIYNQSSENKLTKKNLKIENSVILSLRFQNCTNSEKKYKRKLLKMKVLSCAKSFDFISIVKIIYKYNYRILF